MSFSSLRAIDSSDDELEFVSSSGHPLPPPGHATSGFTLGDLGLDAFDVAPALERSEGLALEQEDLEDFDVFAPGQPNPHRPPPPRGPSPGHDDCVNVDEFSFGDDDLADLAEPKPKRLPPPSAPIGIVEEEPVRPPQASPLSCYTRPEDHKDMYPEIPKKYHRSICPTPDEFTFRLRGDNRVQIFPPIVSGGRSGIGDLVYVGTSRHTSLLDPGSESGQSGMTAAFASPMSIGCAGLLECAQSEEDDEAYVAFSGTTGRLYVAKFSSIGGGCEPRTNEEGAPAPTVRSELLLELGGAFQPNAIRCLSFAWDGEEMEESSVLLAIASGHSSSERLNGLYLVDAVQRRQLARFTMKEVQLASVDLSQDRLWCGGFSIPEKDCVYVLDVETLKLVRQMRVGDQSLWVGGVAALQIEGREAVVTGHGSQALLWDSRDADRVGCIEIPDSGSVHSLLADPPLRQVVLGGCDANGICTAYFYDIRDLGSPVATVQPHMMSRSHGKGSIGCLTRVNSDGDSRYLSGIHYGELSCWKPNDEDPVLWQWDAYASVCSVLALRQF